MMPTFQLAKIEPFGHDIQRKLIALLELPEVMFDEQKFHQVRENTGEWQGWIAQSNANIAADQVECVNTTGGVAGNNTKNIAQVSLFDQKKSTQIDTGTIVGYAHLKGYSTGEQRWSLEIAGDPALSPSTIQSLRNQFITTILQALRDQGFCKSKLHYWQHGVTEVIVPPDGFHTERELARMSRSVATTEHHDFTVQSTAPVTITHFNGGLAQRKGILNVNNAAFGNHPEQGNWTMSILEERLAQPWVRPEDLLLAIDPSIADPSEQIVGFHWTKPITVEEQPAGEVYVVGVHPRMQGQGVGNILMQAGLAHMVSAFHAVFIDLYVDLAETIPVALYRKMGFEIVTKSVCMGITL